MSTATAAPTLTDKVSKDCGHGFVITSIDLNGIAGDEFLAFIYSSLGHYRGFQVSDGSMFFSTLDAKALTKHLDENAHTAREFGIDRYRLIVDGVIKVTMGIEEERESGEEALSPEKRARAMEWVVAGILYHARSA
ncbi:MAG: hypothetical protein KGI69_00300 [Patescibacteria group bacterium]|nr:hypothetical protein [Patescibacteria group bacterium]